MSIIVPSQEEISVFINNNGSITILQKAYPEEDSVIAINPVHISAICKALQDCKKTIQSKS